MYFLIIIYFFLISFGLGYTLLSLLKLKIQNQIIIVGIGLGIFPLLVIILNTIHIPLVWWIFLIIGMIKPLIDLKNITIGDLVKKSRNLRFNPYLFVLFVLFFIHLFIYVSGSYVYPYLENGDPYEHALTSQYIAKYQSYSVPTDKYMMMHYTEAYPPGFSTMNAMLYQLDSINLNANGDMMWILKFFNSLMISLSILFIYFFINLLTNNNKQLALMSSFLLAVVPCFLSHFIFATSLAVMLFFPAFYCIIKMRDNSQQWYKNKWMYITAIVSSGIYLSQPIAAGIFAMFFGIYWLISMIIHKNLQITTFMAGLLGILLSQLFYIPTLFKFGFENIAEKLGFFMFAQGSFDSSGGKIYGIMDYMISPLANKIDTPYGFGTFYFIGLILSIIIIIALRKKLMNSSNSERNIWIISSFIISLLLFIGTQSNRGFFPFKVIPHRLHTFLALFTVIILIYGIYFLYKSIPKNSNFKYAKYGLILFFIIGCIWTSGIPKYKVQTMEWPYDMNYFPPIMNPDGNSYYSPELNALLWIKNTTESNIPWGSNLMTMCYKDDRMGAGMNMGSLTEKRWGVNFSLMTATEITSYAKKLGYEYVLCGVRCQKHNILKGEVILKLLQYNIENVVYHDQNGAFIIKL